MTTTVLVLGARGRFGQAAARAFAAAGWRVIGQMRPDAVPPPVPGIEWCGIALQDTAALMAATAGTSVVVHALNPTTYSKAGFTAADFTPVARVSLAPLVLVVPAESPWKTMGDLIAAGKAAGKGGLPYGSTGAGGISHVASELVNAAADSNFTHVPYRGGAPLAQALMANEVRWGLLGTADARAQIQGGKLRALGQLRATRSELWPDVPTLTEQGVRGGVDFDMWFGLVVPSKTPASVVTLLNDKVARIVAEPDFRRRLNDIGGVSLTSGNTVAAFAEVIQRELDVLPKTARDLGLKLD